MTAGDFAALTARVRAPESAEALRNAAAKSISGDRLEAFMGVAAVSNFVNDKGEVDETRVQRTLSTLFDLPLQPQWQNHGQYTEAPPEPPPGDRGAAEARKRFGSKDTQPAPMRGRAGAAEAERRFGGRKT
jgi:hypothetical protein